MKQMPKKSKERANEYKSSTQEPQSPSSASDAENTGKSTKRPADENPERTKSMKEWHDLVNQRIDEAQQQGAFENLRGHGKPLDLRRNPYAPEDQQMAFNLLQNNDMAPPWILDRKAIQQDVAALRTQIQQVADEHRGLIADAETRAQWQWSWDRHVARWQDEVTELNKRIDALNIILPVPHLELYKLRLTRELQDVDPFR